MKLHPLISSSHFSTKFNMLKSIQFPAEFQIDISNQLPRNLNSPQLE